jgi:hypothetical protein
VGARPSDAFRDCLVVPEDCAAADADSAERSILPRLNVAVGGKTSPVLRPVRRPTDDEDFCLNTGFVCVAVDYQNYRSQPISTMTRTSLSTSGHDLPPVRRAGR